jgi:hypothetical protein
MIFPIRWFFRTEDAINQALHEFEEQLGENVLDIKIINLGTKQRHVMIIYES